MGSRRFGLGSENLYLFPRTVQRDLRSCSYGFVWVGLLVLKIEKQGARLVIYSFSFRQPQLFRFSHKNESVRPGEFAEQGLVQRFEWL